MTADRNRHLRALLSGHSTAEAVLTRVCELCVVEIGLTGARVRVLGGISTDGGGAMVHATDALGARLDDIEDTTGSGPCLDAFVRGAPVLVPDLRAVCGRWPGFTADAITAGAAAVFAFPLQWGGVRLGVLGLHRSSAGSLTPGQLTDAFLLADAATDTIFHDLHGAGSMTLPDLVHLQAEAHQATGMVAASLDVDLPEALARIRARAYASQATLAEVSKDIIERRVRLDSEE